MTQAEQLKQQCLAAIEAERKADYDAAEDENDAGPWDAIRAAANDEWTNDDGSVHFWTFPDGSSLCCNESGGSSSPGGYDAYSIEETPAATAHYKKVLSDGYDEDDEETEDHIQSFLRNDPFTSGPECLAMIVKLCDAIIDLGLDAEHLRYVPYISDMATRSAISYLKLRVPPMNARKA